MHTNAIKQKTDARLRNYYFDRNLLLAFLRLVGRRLADESLIGESTIVEC